MQFLQDLERHLAEWASTHASLADWVPPMTGFVSGQRREGSASNIDGLIEQGILMSASLGTLRALSSTDESAEIAADVWTDEVKTEVVRREADYGGHFGKLVDISTEDALKVRIGFFTPRYAAQFGVLRADSARISRDVLMLKSRIVDLGQLRGDLFKLTEKRELIIGHRDFKRPGMSALDRSRIERRLALIEKEADTFEIRVRAVSSAQAAADIITREAA